MISFDFEKGSTDAVTARAVRTARTGTSDQTASGTTVIGARNTRGLAGCTSTVTRRVANTGTLTSSPGQSTIRYPTSRFRWRWTIRCTCSAFRYGLVKRRRKTLQTEGSAASKQRCYTHDTGTCISSLEQCTILSLTSHASLVKRQRKASQTEGLAASKRRSCTHDIAARTSSPGPVLPVSKLN